MGHFEGHDEKHLISIILTQQIIDAESDLADHILSELDHGEEPTEADETHYTEEILEEEEKQTPGKLFHILAQEIQTHKADIDKYTKELTEVETKISKLAKKDLIAVILAQQAVEAGVDEAQHLLPKVVKP